MLRRAALPPHLSSKARWRGPFEPENLSEPSRGFRSRPGCPPTCTALLCSSLLHCLRAPPRSSTFAHHGSKGRRNFMMVHATRIAEIKSRLDKCPFIRRSLEIRGDMVANADSIRVLWAPGQSRTNRKSGGTAAKRFAVCSDHWVFPHHERRGANTPWQSWLVLGPRAHAEDAPSCSSCLMLVVLYWPLVSPL